MLNALGSLSVFKNNLQVSADATFTCRLFRPIQTLGLSYLDDLTGSSHSLTLNKPFEYTKTSHASLFAVTAKLAVTINRPEACTAAKQDKKMTMIHS